MMDFSASLRLLANSPRLRYGFGVKSRSVPIWA